MTVKSTLRKLQKHKGPGRSRSVTCTQKKNCRSFVPLLAIPANVLWQSGPPLQVSTVQATTC